MRAYLGSLAIPSVESNHIANGVKEEREGGTREKKASIYALREAILDSIKLVNHTWSLTAIWMFSILSRNLHIVVFTSSFKLVFYYSNSWSEHMPWIIKYLLCAHIIPSRK